MEFLLVRLVPHLVQVLHHLLPLQLLFVVHWPKLLQRSQ